MYSFLIPKPPNATIINKVIDQYPANPSLGAPFDTGNITFGHGPIIKQLAAVITDEAFESRRRFFLRQANAHGWNKTWSYQWQGHRPDIPAYMGCKQSTLQVTDRRHARPGSGIRFRRNLVLQLELKLYRCGPRVVEVYDELLD